MMIQNKKIIITGANGFIGSALGNYLKNQTAQIVPLTRANCDYSAEAILTLQNQESADIVVHTAGNSSVSTAQQKPELSEKSSINLTQNIIDGLSKADKKPSIVFLSSAAVYGNNYNSTIHEQAQTNPISVYGEHKLMCEKLIQDYAQNHQTACQIIRIFSLIGANQHRLLPYELFQQFNDPTKQTISLLGSGDEVRDYLSIDAFIEKLCKVLAVLETQQRKYLTLNVASGTPTKTIDLALIIKEIMRAPQTIECLNADIGNNPKSLLGDTALLNELIDNNSHFDLKHALTQIIKNWQK